MKFLRVGNGKAIAVDKIKMIRKSGDFSSKIHTASDVIEVKIPFDTLLNLLQEDTQGVNNQVLNILKEIGVPNP